jgi:hypothetical protein
MGGQTAQHEVRRIAANIAKLPENECRSHSSTPRAFAADAPRAFRQRYLSAIGAQAPQMARSVDTSGMTARE